MSSDRDQLKEIIGGVGFKLGKRPQENKFLSFYELYGTTDRWQKLFVSIPAGLVNPRIKGVPVGAALWGLAGAGPGLWQRFGKLDIGKRLGVSGDIATDFTKLMNKMQEEGKANFDSIFPATGAHIAEQAGDEASRVEEGNWSVFLEKLASDIGYNVDIFKGIKNADDLQDMLIRIDNQLGAGQRAAIQEFIAKYSPEETGEAAILKDKMKYELIPERAAETFDGWKEAFNDLIAEHPDVVSAVTDLFDKAKRAIQ